jgi:hypothetical protein
VKRITQKDLEAVVERINRLQGANLAPYSKLPDGNYRANIGTYHLSYAYGGVSLHRMQSEGGGVDDVFRSGHIPKLKLYYMMQAYVSGLSERKVPSEVN